MNLRKTTSLTTLLSFIGLLITSVVMYVAPKGKIAFWANWEMGGLGKEQWGALHTNLGILFLIAGLIHTVLNWAAIVAYMKTQAKKLKVFTVDFNVALTLTLFIVIFTLLELPPIHGVQTFNESLKEAAAEKYGQPPYGHAEASTLQSFCRRTGLDVGESLKRLEKAELNAVSAEVTLAELARANRMTPQQIDRIIRPASSVDGVANPIPKRPGMGFGRKRLGDVCAAYGLDVQQTIDDLNGLGIKASASSSMKEIARNNDMADHHAVFEIIRELQK